jgi:Ca-activated chloride channel family protein
MRARDFQFAPSTKPPTKEHIMKTFFGCRISNNAFAVWLSFACLSLFLALSQQTRAAGLLRAVGGGDAAVQMKSHHVNVTINNGFARTEVDQIFTNTSDRDLEAIYSFPLPKQSSLSELSLWVNGKELLGEVVERERARSIYRNQRDQGNDVAIAQKNEFKTFDIGVGTVRAGTDTRVRLVYYQPLEIDLGVGRYVYPLAEGGTDDERAKFWATDDVVNESFKFNLQLKSAFPVRNVRLPAYENTAKIQKRADTELGGDVYDVSIASNQGAKLAHDLVFYYRLDDSVPARVELIPYRADASQPGTFMVVVTPAATLKPIAEGTDWVFVLDVSGSMAGEKIRQMAEGVARVIGKLSPNDRFRVVTFNDRAYDLTGGYVTATAHNVGRFIEQVKHLRASGSTALFDGLKLAYRSLDRERTTGVVLVTDGVCNVGPTDHASFVKLLRQYDARLFTFVIGNSANQPLMDRIARDSGGFAMNISENDDLIGRILQAKTKVLNECLHDVKLTFHGEQVRDLTPATIGNLYAGQQLVMFGRYTGHGEVGVELQAKVSGEKKTWRCKAFLPERDTANPELERLWALSAIEDVMERIREQGETDSLRQRVVELGMLYSLVTDFTSMLVVHESVTDAEDIGRANAERVQRERAAQQARLVAPVQNSRADRAEDNRAFGNQPAPTIRRSSGGGGGFGSGPVGPLMLVLIAWLARRKRRA